MRAHAVGANATRSDVPLGGAGPRRARAATLNAAPTADCAKAMGALPELPSQRRVRSTSAIPQQLGSQPDRHHRG